MNDDLQDSWPSHGLVSGVGDGAIVQLMVLARTLWRSPYRSRIGLLAAGIVMVVCANAVGQIRLDSWQGAFYDALEQKQMRGVRDPAPGLRGDRRRPARPGRGADLAAGDDQGPAARMADLRPARPVAGAQAGLHAGLRRPDRRQSRPAHPPGHAASDRAHDDPGDRPAAGVAAAVELRRRALAALGAGRVRVSRAAAS